MENARVEAIWRHPVKSLRGEQLSEAILDPNGLRGDRCWGVRDERTGKILTGRREPRLLLASAALDDGGEPVITLPSGGTCRGAGPHTDEALSDWLQAAVSLVSSIGAPGGDAEYFSDATDDTSAPVAWTMPSGRFVDASPLLLLTTASLRAGRRAYPDGQWDVRRFRPNILIDAPGDDYVEDGWCGRLVQIGATQVAPRQGCVRCTMVTRPQPELTRDLDIYKTIAREHAGTFGVWADVDAAGTVRVGDVVTTTGDRA